MSYDHYLRRVMSGADRGIGAATLRAGLAIVEPFYTMGVRSRNRGFDRHPERIRRLPRPVVSIGNITTGGTGKTPIVRWLASRLRENGRGVAVLARGYKAAPGSLGDEQRMLDSLLNPPNANAATASSPIVIKANPDRFAAGLTALQDEPDLDVFLLDDGFQHRRLARDLDIVLIDAREPFGFGHVLPRGLLREPLEGLTRAGAIVLTHVSAVEPDSLNAIELEIRRHNQRTPIYRADHAALGWRVAAEALLHPMQALQSRRAFAFCGLASPTAFERDVRAAGSLAGHRWFADHHSYTPADLANVRMAARQAGADVMVTTEKDWVKLAGIPGATDVDLPIWRLDVAATFLGDDESRLSAQIERAIGNG